MGYKLSTSHLQGIKTMKRWMNKSVARTYNKHVNLGCLTLCCCYLDALAGFYYGVNRELPNKRFGKSEDRFVGFVNKYMKAFRAEGRNKTMSVITCRDWGSIRREEIKYANILYKHFRNGLVHEHMMKGLNAVAREKDNRIFLDGDQYDLVINLSPFVNDFRRSLALYVTDLRNGKRINQFIRRHNFVTRR